MKRLTLVLMLVVAAGMLSGCAGYFSSPVVPPPGWAFTDYAAPQDADLDETSLGNKTGTASSENVLGLVAWGDASVQTAARNGGIDQINQTDYRFFNILGVYSKYTTVVYGE